MSPFPVEPLFGTPAAVALAVAYLEEKTMHDIRKSPRLMGHVRLEMEAALGEDREAVKWLRGEGLAAVYRVTVEPSGDRVEGTLTHLFEHFNLTLPDLWRHALDLEAEELRDRAETA